MSTITAFVNFPTLHMLATENQNTMTLATKNWNGLLQLKHRTT